MADKESGASCVSEEWCGIEWTPWYSFTTASNRTDSIPDIPGIYRIRAAGNPTLMYIGETGQSLRRTFSEIRQNTARFHMPWTEPQPVAPALWAWKDAKGFTYEFSAYPMPESPSQRMAGLHFLLYRYRQEYRDSPACNFGRFHRKYRRSSTESEGMVGGKVGPKDPLNAAGGPAASPLTPKGSPGDTDWMGLAWSPKRELKTHTTSAAPQAPGLFLIFNADSGDLLSIGRSDNCSKALFEISKNLQDGKKRAYSFWCDKKPVSDHNLMEQECDLIGNYVETRQNAPEHQFRE